MTIESTNPYVKNHSKEAKKILKGMICSRHACLEQILLVTGVNKCGNYMQSSKIRKYTKCTIAFLHTKLLMTNII